MQETADAAEYGLLVFLRDTREKRVSDMLRNYMDVWRSKEVYVEVLLLMLIRAARSV